jgi:hypothetical protein
LVTSMGKNKIGFPVSILKWVYESFLVYHVYHKEV